LIAGITGQDGSAREFQKIPQLCRAGLGEACGIDPRYLRPEVDSLIGDGSKAKRQLNREQKKLRNWCG
jgi:GDP-D-mannose dehydratase